MINDSWLSSCTDILTFFSNRCPLGTRHTQTSFGRQYGSGGREIGKKLAAKLGIPCHDKAIVERTAKEKGYCEDIIKQFDETHSRSLLFSIAMNSYGSWYANNDYKPLQASVREAQVNIIRELAKTPCVIIGRAADSILADMDPVNIFILADDTIRIKRIMQRRNFSEKEASEAIASADKERAQFYRHYSDKRWGYASNYHLTIDSGILGIENTVDFLVTYLELLATRSHLK